MNVQVCVCAGQYPGWNTKSDGSIDEDAVPETFVNPDGTTINPTKHAAAEKALGFYVMENHVAKIPYFNPLVQVHESS